MSASSNTNSAKTTSDGTTPTTTASAGTNFQQKYVPWCIKNGIISQKRYDDVYESVQSLMSISFRRFRGYSSGVLGLLSAIQHFFRETVDRSRQIGANVPSAEWGLCFNSLEADYIKTKLNQYDPTFKSQYSKICTRTYAEIVREVIIDLVRESNKLRVLCVGFGDGYEIAKSFINDFVDPFVDESNTNTTVHIGVVDNTSFEASCYDKFYAISFSVYDILSERGVSTTVGACNSIRVLNISRHLDAREKLREKLKNGSDLKWFFMKRDEFHVFDNNNNSNKSDFGFVDCFKPTPDEQSTPEKLDEHLPEPNPIITFSGEVEHIEHNNVQKVQPVQKISQNDDWELAGCSEPPQNLFEKFMGLYLNAAKRYLQSDDEEDNIIVELVPLICDSIPEIYRSGQTTYAKKLSNLNAKLLEFLNDNNENDIFATAIVEIILRCI